MFFRNGIGLCALVTARVVQEEGQQEVRIQAEGRVVKQEVRIQAEGHVVQQEDGGCSDKEEWWTDSEGYNCAHYYENDWCGYNHWPAGWHAKDGVDATQACCGCVKDKWRETEWPLCCCKVTSTKFPTNTYVDAPGLPPDCFARMAKIEEVFIKDHGDPALKVVDCFDRLDSSHLGTKEKWNNGTTVYSEEEKEIWRGRTRCDEYDVAKKAIV